MVNKTTFPYFTASGALDNRPVLRLNYNYNMEKVCPRFGRILPVFVFNLNANLFLGEKKC